MVPFSLATADPSVCAPDDGPTLTIGSVVGVESTQPTAMVDDAAVYLKPQTSDLATRFLLCRTHIIWTFSIARFR